MEDFVNMPNTAINIIACDKNTPNQMGDFVAEQIKTAKQVDILTGYFFFDGFEAIQTALETNQECKLRILVGMDAGVDTSGLIHELYKHEEAHADDDAVRKEYLEQLRQVLRNWPTERLAKYQSDAWKRYATMIETGHLQIRKTRRLNHSKVYIFHKRNGEIAYTGGSSNFSYSGLCARNEFNIRVVRERADDVAKLFNELWDNAVPIAEFKKTSETPEQGKPPVGPEIVETLKADTPDSAVKPFDACMKVLREYKKLNMPQKDVVFRIHETLRQVGYDHLQYQIDAVSTAQNILKANGGVIIADVVGLGKSVMASLLAKLSDGPGVVLAPPALLQGKKGWYSYLIKFGLAKTGKSSDESWSAWSMYNPDPGALEKAETIIIDEVHNLRNPNTQLYQTLYESIQKSKIAKRVICLSATPYNNRLDDLVSLFRLFPSYGCGGKKEELVKKLEEAAKKLDDLKTDIRIADGDEKVKKIGERNELIRQVMNLVYPLTVRRNRIDLRIKYGDEIGDRIPFLAPPINKKAELSAAQSLFYDDILKKYFAGDDPLFKGAMYHPQTYTNQKNDSNAQNQQNLYSMICRFMVSRWESSPAAFKNTLDKLLSSLDAGIKIFDDTGIFFRGVEDVGEETDEDLKQRGVTATTDVKALLVQIAKFPRKSPVYIDQVKCRLAKEDMAKATGKDIFVMTPEQAKTFRDELSSDLNTLAEIKRRYEECGLDDPKNDGKLTALIEVIEEILKKGVSYGRYEIIQGSKTIPHDAGVDKPQADNPRKIIVFSYYADTARYVRNELENRYPGKILYADGSCLDKDSKEEIEKHFMASGEKAKSDEKMILVCTDVLSEGVNLNQSGVVINYDIAYNPVRVIQRIGRINRIDVKVFERLYSVNFFPTGPTDTHIDLNNVEEIAVGKMMDIHALLGEDSCILSNEEKPRPAEFLKEISPDEREKATVGIDTEMDALYAEGLRKLHLVTEEQIRDYEKKLDDLIPRWSVMAQLGNERKLYIFKKNYSSILVTEIPDCDDKGIPARLDMPCAAILKQLMAQIEDPQAESLPFEPSNEDPVWRSYRTFKDGNGYDQDIGSKAGALNDIQQGALKALLAVQMPNEEKNVIGAIVRKSAPFAEQFIKCDNDLEVIRTLVRNEKNKSAAFIPNDGKEFMTIGTERKEK